MICFLAWLLQMDPNGRKEEYFPIYVGLSDTASIVGNLNFRLPKGC